MDTAVAVGTAVAMLVLTQIATEEGSAPPDLVAYLLAGLIGMALLWRRNHPTGVAVASLFLVLAYHALGYPAIGSLPLAVALLNASYYSATIPAVAIAAVTMSGTLIWFLVGESRAVGEAVNFAIREAAILAAVILTGAVLRSHRQLAEESAARLRLMKADQEARSARRLAEERMQIAREIHDVVAHTVAVIGVQAKVAAETLRDSPEDAEKALRIINDSTRDASSELQATVGVLRSHPSLTPAPRLDQLEELVQSVAAGGLDVELSRPEEPREVSGLVELVAYRVVQEALTNVVRHASATRAIVEIDFNTTELAVTVYDDGSGGEITEGFGITGMRERVDAIGGNLEIGPASIGGLRVEARLPVGDAR